MEVTIQIPFQQLVDIVRQLPPQQKAELRKILKDDHTSSRKRSQLREKLLNGPVFTEEQIMKIEETRKSINQWRKKPL